MKLTDQALADLIEQLQGDHVQVGKDFIAHDGYSDRLATELCHIGQAMESLRALRNLRRKENFNADCVTYTAADIPVTE